MSTENPLDIVIIGSGAMGSIFGALLSSTANVKLIDSWENHVKAISENGLRIEHPDGDKQYFVEIFSDHTKIEGLSDIAIIFTKSSQTEAAARIADSLLKEKGLALSLQNGVGNIDIIEGIVGKGRAVAGVTSHGGTLTGPGQVRHAGKGPTHIARINEASDRIEAIARVFNASGIETTLEENLDSLIWGKLIVNVGINAMAAIMRTPNGVLGKTPACIAIMEKAVWEAVDVARKLNIQLPYEHPLEHVRKICELTASNRASMLQDILRGAQTEIDVINGAIVQKGEKMNIPTPYNRFLTEIIKALEATSSERIC